MTALQRLGLSADAVRRMTAPAIPQPAQKPKEKSKYTHVVPSWFHNWILNVKSTKPFTLTEVCKLHSKKRGTAQCAVSLAVRRGLVEIVQHGHGGKAVSIYRRTKLKYDVKPYASKFFRYIIGMKPGETLDYLHKMAGKKEIAVNTIKRSLQAGILERCGNRPLAETIYRSKNV